jgi:hypothetical protein
MKLAHDIQVVTLMRSASDGVPAATTDGSPIDTLKLGWSGGVAGRGFPNSGQLLATVLATAFSCSTVKPGRLKTVPSAAQTGAPSGRLK